MNRQKDQVQPSQSEISLQMIVEPLLAWYDQNARKLPWRENTDPYRVWISEIMLQQTRVDTVIPYFERFINRLPTVQDLADVSQEELFKLWEGLGYYTRAKNLKKGAQEICSRFGGIFPQTPQQLLTVPGIGPYTAGAICSICFEQPTPAVDGNVLRVITRLTADDADISALSVRRRISQQLAQIYPDSRRGDFTQSIMELGAMICLPNGQPKCESCPLNKQCQAYADQTQLLYPSAKPKKERQVEHLTVFLLIDNEEELAVRIRTEKGVLTGLWELPNVQGSLSEDQIHTLLDQWGISFTKIEKAPQKKHIFTHKEWLMHCFIVHCCKSDLFTWVTPQQLQTQTALPTAFQKCLPARFRH